MEPESIEDYYDRVARATDDEGRLAVAIEAMPGWDIFPFELDGLRIKSLEPLADREADRFGEDPADCSCHEPEDPERAARTVWSNERWQLKDAGMKLPVTLILRPRAHHDLADLPDDLAAEMGLLMVAITAAVEALPSVGRCHVGRYGDGGAHLHPFFFGRPTRMPQLRGSCVLDWEENLPDLPDDVRRANAAFVGRALVARLGGDGPAWES
jgi:diadenosine tetraphosphate (Ap4A) HIT family hydrolase